MSKKVTIIAAVAVLGMAGTNPAPAQVVPGHLQGENFAASMDPSRTNNFVGGGLLRTTGAGENMQVDYEKSFDGGSRAGMPSWSGGQNGDIIYTPIPSAIVQQASTRR